MVGIERARRGRGRTTRRAADRLRRGAPAVTGRRRWPRSARGSRPRSGDWPARGLGATRPPVHDSGGGNRVVGSREVIGERDAPTGWRGAGGRARSSGGERAGLRWKAGRTGSSRTRSRPGAPRRRTRWRTPVTARGLRGRARRAVGGAARAVRGGRWRLEPRAFAMAAMAARPPPLTCGAGPGTRTVRVTVRCTTSWELLTAGRDAAGLSGGDRRCPACRRSPRRRLCRR